MPKFTPKARIQTWGTQTGDGLGILKELQIALRSENVGHAAISLEIEATPDNKKLVQHYCDNPAEKIPYSHKWVQHKDGSIQQIIVVRFSFGPDKVHNKPFKLFKTYQEDCEYELAGHNTSARDILEINEINPRNALTRIIHVYPACSLTNKGHSLDFSSPGGKYIVNRKQIYLNDDLLDTAKILKTKLGELAHTFPINLNKSSHAILLFNMERLNLQLPNNKQLLNESQLQQFIGRLNKKIKDINKDNTRILQENKQLLKSIQNENERIRLKKQEEDYLLKGRPADSDVELPIGNEPNQLSLKAMLEQMQQIIIGQHKHKLLAHNCATTTQCILQAGIRGTAINLKPATLFAVMTPHMIFNQAIHQRDKLFKKSIANSLSDLEHFFLMEHSVPILIKRKEFQNIDDAIKHFTVHTLFPDNSALRNKVFFLLSDTHKNQLIKISNQTLTTELLHDLWGIIPQRTLPFDLDGKAQVYVDKNMTYGELIQGLNLASQIAATKRLSLETAPPKNPYAHLQAALSEQCDRLGKNAVPGTRKYSKYVKLATTLEKEIAKLDTMSLSDKEKAQHLFDELTPYLQIHTCLPIGETTAYKAIKKTALKLGLGVEICSNNPGFNP